MKGLMVTGGGGDDRVDVCCLRAHRLGLAFQTSICCWVLGYAKEKQPEDAVQNAVGSF